MLKEAVDYIKKGWYVFPMHSVISGECTCGRTDCKAKGKHCATKSWKNDASLDPNQIENWFTDSMYGIGIVTGERSGITVVDIDTGGDKQGVESWQEIIEEHGEPLTLTARSGGGGVHLYFKYSPHLKTSVSVLGKDIDVRNDGAHINAPPSLHASGERYRWLNDETLAEVPYHLVEAAKKDKKEGNKKEGNKKRKKEEDAYPLSEIESMLESISPDSMTRDFWRAVGIALGRAYHRDPSAWQVYSDWCDRYTGKKSPQDTEVMKEAFYKVSQESSEHEIGLGTIVKMAAKQGWVPDGGFVPIQDFVYYAPDNNFIYIPTMRDWPAISVNCAVKPVNEDGLIIKASKWLQKHMLATSMARDPSLEEGYMRGYVNHGGEIIPNANAAIFNTYRRPRIELGDASLAKVFVDHVHKVYNKVGDADQFLNYMAHRVQKPGEKPRFALLIAGMQGTGKDTAIEFCIPAIGVWNVKNVEAHKISSDFNEYESATLIRISEQSSVKETSKWAFNEQIKTLIAGNPDYVEINPKYGSKFSARRFNGTIVTTNHLMSGIFIPEGDRRYDVIDSATKEEMGIETHEAYENYIQGLWRWFKQGGIAHVAAFLHERDISAFCPNTGQRKTQAHKDVVSMGFKVDEWLIDAIGQLGEAEFLVGKDIIAKAVEGGSKKQDVQKMLTMAMLRNGYTCLRSPAKDGRWKKGGIKLTIFTMRKNSTQEEVERFLDTYLIF